MTQHRHRLLPCNVFYHPEQPNQYFYHRRTYIRACRKGLRNYDLFGLTPVCVRISSWLNCHRKWSSAPSKSHAAKQSRSAVACSVERRQCRVRAYAGLMVGPPQGLKQLLDGKGVLRPKQCMGERPEQYVQREMSNFVSFVRWNRPLRMQVWSDTSFLISGTEHFIHFH